MHTPMNIVSLPHPNKHLVIEPLDYPNVYDFHHPHRHDYFEIILVKEGTGHQFIDFTQYQLLSGEIYLVYPGQVHLLKREHANGLLIQFRKDIFEFIFPLQHHQFYFPDPQLRLSPEIFLHLYHLTEHIAGLQQQESLSVLSIHKAYSYLQIILISLMEQGGAKRVTEEGTFASRFLSLLHLHIKDKRKVGELADMMHLTTDKFTALCKQAFGKTPLKLIHEELILEIRRMMLLNQLSLKEIAYELNFDSPANFTAFIRSVMNKTPSELQQEILQLYR